MITRTRKTLSARTSALAGLAVVGLTAVAAGPLPAQAGTAAVHASTLANWPQYQDNAEHTGYNTEETTIGPGNVASLRLVWTGSTDSTNQGMGGPVISGGRAFLGTYGDSTLRAWNAASGAADWSITGGDTDSTPAVGGGRVFIEDESGDVYAFSAATGALLWQQGILPSASSPALVDGVLYVTGLYNVYALSAATGAVLWDKFFSGISIFTNPAVADGRVFVSTGNPEAGLIAFSASTGAIVWQRKTRMIDMASTVVSGGHLYVCSEAGLADYVAATGRRLWLVPGGCDEYTTPAVAQGVVYTDATGIQGGPDGLYAFSASTGALLWQGSSTGTGEAPVVANGVVYASTGSGTVVAYDTATRALLWTSPADALRTLALVNGTLYAAGGDGLYAFGLGAG